MSDGVARFVELLRSTGQRRVGLNQLQSAYDAAFPHLRGSPGARAEMATLLRDLAERNVLRLPKAPGLYDRVQMPELPNWVHVESEDTAKATLNLREHPWHPDLAFARELRNVGETLARDLLRVQAFLSEPRDSTVITERERSLEIFGDEKRLEELASGQLFAPGRLTLARLGCRRVAVPFVHRVVGDGTDALIVENKDTFNSACEAVAENGTRIRSVIFGAGKGIAASIAYLDEWEERPRVLWYFGDVDAEGLRIPVSLMEPCGRLTCSIPLLPAAPLYEALVERAAALKLSLKGTPASQAEASKLVEWLPRSVRQPVLSVLASRGRWPQEALRRADLRRALLRLAEPEEAAG